MEIGRHPHALEIVVSTLGALAVALMPPLLVVGLASFGPDPVGPTGSLVVTGAPATAWLAWHRLTGRWLEARTVRVTAALTIAWMLLLAWEHRPGASVPLWPGSFLVGAAGIVAIAYAAWRTTATD